MYVTAFSLRVYLNGQLFKEESKPTSTSVNWTLGQFVIGEGPEREAMSGESHAFDIDDVAFWSAPLTTEDIQYVQTLGECLHNFVSLD